MTPRDDSDANSNRWSDLDRPPLNAVALRRALVRSGGHDGLWTEVEVVQNTGSTNSDLVALATAGKAEEGAVLVAEEQNAGRGRLDRQWTAPARSGLFFSVLLKPAEVPVERWGWLPLLTGVAVATGLSRAAGVDTALKWPNDLLVTVDGAERKTGGILAERAGPDGVVVGIGINVTLRQDELPVPTAGSLALAGAATTDRDTILRAVLRSLEQWYGKWRSAGGDPAGVRPPGDLCRRVRDPRAGGAGRAARRAVGQRRGGGRGRRRTARAGHGGGRAAARGGGGHRASAAGGGAGGREGRVTGR